MSSGPATPEEFAFASGCKLVNEERETLLMEHLAARSRLSLRRFCVKVRSALNLPKFRFGSENETEWGFVRIGAVEYNISRPYEASTLREWDDTVPEGCNFGISLMVYRGHPNPDHQWVSENLVEPVAQRLANALGVTMHYHRTWEGPGRNTPRSRTFLPDAG